MNKKLSSKIIYYKYKQHIDKQNFYAFCQDFLRVSLSLMVELVFLSEKFCTAAVGLHYHFSFVM